MKMTSDFFDASAMRSSLYFFAERRGKKITDQKTRRKADCKGTRDSAITSPIVFIVLSVFVFQVCVCVCVGVRVRAATWTALAPARCQLRELVHITASRHLCCTRIKACAHSNGPMWRGTATLPPWGLTCLPSHHLANCLFVKWSG